MRRRVLGFVFTVALVAAAVTAAIVAPSASAHTGTATISCTKVDFSFKGFTNGATVDETVSIDGTIVVSQQFTFTGHTGSNSVSITVGPGTHTVKAHARWTVDGGGGLTVKQVLSGCVPPCPEGQKISFRWHYSANGTSGSWSGTKSTTCPGSVTMGPQAMEGDLKVAPGTTLKAGYDFTLPGNNASLSVTVNNPAVVFTVRCVSGAAPSASTFTVSMPTQIYSVVDSAWYPSGDQHSPLVYQGSIAVPDLCAGGQLRLDKGGTFSASVT